MCDLSLKWNKLNKFVEFAIFISWSYSLFNNCTENIGFGFGMVFLSSEQTELYVFPVWAAAIFGSDFQ